MYIYGMQVVVMICVCVGVGVMTSSHFFCHTSFNFPV